MGNTIESEFYNGEDYSNILDILEICTENIFSFQNCDINKFYSEYFGVVNISNYQIRFEELEILGKGIKFCPTPPLYDHGAVKENIDKFFRNANLFLFFSEEDHSQREVENSTDGFKHEELKIPSKFNPPKPNMLEHIQEILTDRILNHNPSKARPRNLTKKQYQLLDELQNNNSIVIKKADKGSNIVIMDREFYTKEALRQLTDTKFYTRCTRDLTLDHHQKVQELILDMFNKKIISEQCYKFLSTGGKRTSIFYLLPKIHKNLLNPPGRPIVSSVDCPTERISMMLDIILQPLLLNTKSYIKDTPDFLRKIEELTILSEENFFTLDVTSLYTNIPLEESLDIMEKEFFPKTNCCIPILYLRKLLELILKCNNFKFDRKHYLQINGTAMGTRVAPTYANLFMAHFEEKYIYSHNSKPRKWFRFIDDIWGIFNGNKDSFKKFNSEINSIHESIKFTGSFSNTEVDFLDVTTYRKNSKIYSKLYCKPTDSHSYLEFNSCHPPNNKTSIPYSQFLRIRRNCTEWEFFIENGLKLTQYFSIRGYPLKLVRDAFLKVNALTRKEILWGDKSKRSDDETKKLFLILDFNPSLPPIKEWLLELWPILYKSSGTRKLVDVKPIIGYRKPKNIKDILITSDLPEIKWFPSKKRISIPRCNRSACRHCPVLDKTGWVKSTSTGRKYRTQTRISCTSSNVIYLIQCNICKKQYVGQTRNKILIRLNQHYSTIRTKQDTPVSRHFNSHQCKEPYPVRIFILSLIKNCDDASENRNKWERYWMARLNTYVPYGMNIQD